MVGTLARLLAEKQIETPAEKFWADVQGDIEEVNGVLRITQIRGRLPSKSSSWKARRRQASPRNVYYTCPAATSVMDCIRIKDQLVFENSVEQLLLKATLSIRDRAFVCCII